MSKPLAAVDSNAQSLRGMLSRAEWESRVDLEWKMYRRMAEQLDPAFAT